MVSRITTAMRLLVLGTLLAASPAAPAHDVGAHPAKDYSRMWQERLEKAPQHAVSLRFDTAGRLWLARAAGKHVVVSHSDDLGQHFSAPVQVNREPELVDAAGENRPKIAVADRRVFVSWTQSLAQPFSGNVRFAVSGDGGASFSTPMTINDNRDPISHRFDALFVGRDGRITLAWLDARERGSRHEYLGAAVYVAESDDNGKTFGANRKLVDHSCECCRIALAGDADGTPVAFWRHVFAGADGSQLRDFALARLDRPAEPPQRATQDDWQLNGCPHHGGDLAIDARGSRHLAWFTGAAGKAGLYYRRIDGVQARAAMRFGDADQQPGHASVLVSGDHVFLAWQEYDGKTLRIQVMASPDRGEHWSKPITQATTAHAADYPQLLSGRGKVWLAWNTGDEGLRLWPVDALGTLDAAP